jgi:succinate-acetate transporter protein
MADKNAPLQRKLTPGGHLEERGDAALPTYHRTLANPAPAGLLYVAALNHHYLIWLIRTSSAMASTLLVFSLFNVQARHVTIINGVVGMSVFVGGFGQLVAGMLEMAAGPLEF